MPPSILYVSDVVPFVEMGGPVVIRRHLERLSDEGWKVRAAVPPRISQRLLASSPRFEVTALPERKWWWPPNSPHHAALAHLRARFWAAHLRRTFERQPARPTAIVTVLWGHLSGVALRLARAWNVPLVVIVHDLLREHAGTARASRILGNVHRAVLGGARHVFAVTAEMCRELRASTPADVTVLPPLPEGAGAPPGGWQPRFRRPPVLAHLGSFHPMHAQMLIPLAGALQRRGGQLIVVAAPENQALTTLRAAGASFRVQPPLRSSSEALAFLAREASGLVVGYPFALPDGIGAPTGFPSRLVEFSHVGVPVVCMGTADNPLQTWARGHDWPLRITEPGPSPLECALDTLSDEPTWNALSLRLRQIAAQEFDPIKIHHMLRDALTAPSSSRR